MNDELRESLYDLYELGGVELLKQGCRGMRRELIIDLETSALSPEQRDIVRFRAVNRWDEDDEFQEYARPPIPPSNAQYNQTPIRLNWRVDQTNYKN